MSQTRAPAVVVVAGFAVLTALLTIDVGGLDTTTQALRELGRGVLAGALLFAIAGYAVTERLVPAAMAPLRLLLVLPVGAAVSGLALTALGFAHMPLNVSIALVLVAGVIGAWWVRRGRPRRPHDRRVAGFAAIGALVVVLALVPILRAGFATVPGQNPDASLVTGLATLLQHAPPTATRYDLPVPQMPNVWRSKYPIFYSLGAVAKLARLDPIQAFPAVAALLAAFVAVGFGVLAVYVLGLSVEGGLLTAAVVGLHSIVFHLALHPYWNQLWGLAAFPLVVLFAWVALAERSIGAGALFVLMLTLAGLAYPLMLPYPLIAALVFAIALRRRPRLPRWSHRRWAIALVLAAAALAAPLVGAAEKVSEGVREFLHPMGSSWRGDVLHFLPLGDFVSTGGGVLPLLAVAAFALLALIRKVPRPQAIGLAAVLGLSVLVDVRLRLAPLATYVDFKHLTFAGLLGLTLAVAGAVWLLERRRGWALAGTAALLACVAAATVRTRDELDGTREQVTTSMLELRSWSGVVTPRSIIRLDMPHSGFQLWAAYFLHDHLTSSPDPVRGAVNQRIFPGERGAFSLALSPGLNRDFVRSGVKVPVPRDVLEPPLRSNSQFVLRRTRSPAPG